MKDAKHVARGAALLDHYYPNWHLKIDLDKLNMWSTTNCTLGQLYGSYALGLKEIRLSGPGLLWGFMSWLPTLRSERKLRQAWIALILERRIAGAWENEVNTLLDRGEHTFSIN